MSSADLHGDPGDAGSRRWRRRSDLSAAPIGPTATVEELESALREQLANAERIASLQIGRAHV